MHLNGQNLAKSLCAYRVCIGETLTQIWMKYTYKWVSYEANNCMFKKVYVNFT